jgi:hypothetical protein
MKQELYDNLTEMCRQCDVSPRIECIIFEMLQDAYHNGWEDAMNEKTPD